MPPSDTIDFIGKLHRITKGHGGDRRIMFTIPLKELNATLKLGKWIRQTVFVCVTKD